MVQGRCMRCRKRMEMESPEIGKTARGGYMAKGKCKDCGTKMSAMISKDNAEKAVEEGAKKSF